jgi:phage shock protein E
MENSMPKKSHRKTYQSETGAFLRRPIVQIGIVLIAVAVIILLVVLAGNNKGLPLEISIDKAYSMYQNDAFVLDVRTESEWSEFHAPGTTLIPLDQLASRLNEVPRDRQIVVVCRSGNRSQQGRDILLQAGFTQVTSMSGGLNAWRNAGYPIEP